MSQSCAAHSGTLELFSLARFLDSCSTTFVEYRPNENLSADISLIPHSETVKPLFSAITTYYY